MEEPMVIGAHSRAKLVAPAMAAPVADPGATHDTAPPSARQHHQRHSRQASGSRSASRQSSFGKETATPRGAAGTPRKMDECTPDVAHRPMSEQAAASSAASSPLREAATTDVRRPHPPAARPAIASGAPSCSRGDAKGARTQRAQRRHGESGLATENDADAAQTPRDRLTHVLRRPRSSRSPRAEVVADLPHLAGAPTTALLMALDDGRRVAESEERFADAQALLVKMRALTAHEAQRAIRNVQQRGAACEAARGIIEQNRRQLLEFTALWERTLGDYDAKAAALLRDATERHHQRVDEGELLLQGQLAQQRPHFSRRVIHLRELLETKVQLQAYAEAELVKKELRALEVAEEAAFEESLSATFASKTKQLRKKFNAEHAALKQRVSAGRDELLAQRRLDYANLVQRHANAVTEAQQRTRTEAAKEQKALQRQLQALLAHPRKKSIPALAS